MPEIHLRQPTFSYSASVPFTKIKKKYKNSKEQKTQDLSITTNETRGQVRNLETSKILEILETFFQKF